MQTVIHITPSSSHISYSSSQSTLHAEDYEVYRSDSEDTLVDPTQFATDKEDSLNTDTTAEIAGEFVAAEGSSNNATTGTSNTTNTDCKHSQLEGHITPELADEATALTQIATITSNLETSGSHELCQSKCSDNTTDPDCRTACDSEGTSTVSPSESSDSIITVVAAEGSSNNTTTGTSNATNADCKHLKLEGHITPELADEATALTQITTITSNLETSGSPELCQSKCSDNTTGPVCKTACDSEGTSTVPPSESSDSIVTLVD